VYFCRPDCLMAWTVQAPSVFRLFGELPPRVATVKLNFRFGKDRWAASEPARQARDPAPVHDRGASRLPHLRPRPFISSRRRTRPAESNSFRYTSME